MKTRLLIIFALVMIPVLSESFAEELEIKFGETISYDNLKLYFYDVEDSRCPSDVTCIWEGKVAAMIHISNETHKTGGSLEIGYPMTYITPYTITLLDVKPHPISTEKSIYVATLEITKSESKFDKFIDEQISNDSCPVFHFLNYAWQDCGSILTWSILGIPLLVIIAVPIIVISAFVIWRIKNEN